jgi:hypothetical protein
VAPNLLRLLPEESSSLKIVVAIVVLVDIHGVIFDAAAAAAIFPCVGALVAHRSHHVMFLGHILIHFAMRS